jgi:hypothetical protein
MTFSRFFRHRATRHGLGWLVLLALLLLRQDSTTPHFLRRLAETVAIMAVAIYAHFWLLTHLLDRQRFGRYAVAMLVLLLASGAALAVSQQLARGGIAVQALGSAYGVGHAVGNVAMVLVLATAARYVRRGIVSHFQLQQLRALQLETELSLLKAQVNQHFLFNTLNNLYGLSLAAPDQMPEALLQLAGLMRYQLDSSRQSTVTVGTEAEYLANYIGLEKLRLRENTQVEFITDLPHPDRPLAPLLLLPLVENCFKHAIGPSGANTIRIHLTQTDTGLMLRTGNSIPPHFRPAPSGLGLPTLRARLAQFYPGPRHRLTIEASETFYAANLQLVL